MKKIILAFSTIVFMFSFTTIVKADETTFNVNGNATCKTQIEALVTAMQGVSSAVWDATTKKITIVYDPAIVMKDKFYVALAEGGYDNQELHAKNNKYDALPTECKYTREAETD